MYLSTVPRFTQHVFQVIATPGEYMSYGNHCSTHLILKPGAEDFLKTILEGSDFKFQGHAPLDWACRELSKSDLRVVIGLIIM